MAEPEADRRDVDEAQEAFGGLVVAGGDATGILELVGNGPIVTACLSLG